MLMFLLFLDTPRRGPQHGPFETTKDRELARQGHDERVALVDGA